MPRRSNEFQKLIARIYEQISGKGGIVRESVMLREHQSGAEREIDILLEQSTFGTSLRIGVECRDRGRKGDVEWIDGLIGKYRDLPVDKVSAVSSRGFSKAATQKANANRIDTLTLQQALETDWPSEFFRLGIACLSRNDRPVRLNILTDPKTPSQLTLDTQIFDEGGATVASAYTFGQAIFKSSKDELSTLIGNQMPTLFKTVGDLSTKSLQSVLSYRPSRPIFIREGAELPLRIKCISVFVNSEFTVELAKVRHYLLCDMQASLTELSIDGEPRLAGVIQQKSRPNVVQFQLGSTKGEMTLPEKLADHGTG